MTATSTRAAPILRANPPDEETLTRSPPDMVEPDTEPILPGHPRGGGGPADRGISCAKQSSSGREIVMAERKKPYRRFEELTKKAIAPAGAGQGSTDPEHGGGSPPETELSIWLSPAVRRALLERAATNNTTASKIVEEALRRHLPL
jgi:hypothetical protein